ncbi:MAG: amidohydrolase [Chloroflexi bacterium]|nr:amidohydrolase [Chloroflexota bacterium]
MAELIVTHGTILTMDGSDSILADGALVIENGRISAIGDTKKVAQHDPGAEVIDATGMLVMPGLVNTHTHLGATILRGISDDVDGIEWMPLNWSVTRHTTQEDLYLAALLGIAEMIASGTTCFSDSYQDIEQTARAVAETGIRAELASGLTERNGRKDAQRLMEQARSFVAEWNGKAGGRIHARFGPHALYTCSTDYILQARQAADDLHVGMHMHLAESPLEMKTVKKKAGETSVQHLHALGVLKPDFLIAHALTINEQDIRLIAEDGSGIAHCPQSLGKLGAYPFPAVDTWIRAGIHVGIGTDGVASNNNLDLFEELRFASLTRKLFARDGRVLPAGEVLRMATVTGAKALGLGNEIGSLEAGKKADIILIDVRKPHLAPFHNIPGLLVYSALGSDVDTVIVDGKVLLRNRQFTTLDIADIMERVQAAFQALLKRAGWNLNLAEPTQSMATVLKLKATQQSLKIFQALMENRQSKEESGV